MAKRFSDPRVVPYTFEAQHVNVEKNPGSENANGYSYQKQGMRLEITDLDDAIIKKSTVENNGIEYNLLPVEIEKIAEIGLVVGHIEGQNWTFIDEILPNGMIDMHGVLKEGDCLLQAGPYSLAGFDVATVLLLIERAYDEGRKTLTLVAARPISNSKPQKSSGNILGGTSKPTITILPATGKDPDAAQIKVRSASTRAQSFVSYEHVEAEDNDENDSDYLEPPKRTQL